MLEMLIKPRRVDKKPWEMFFVGLVYSSLAILIVGFIFAKDSVLSQYGGILVVTFTVLFSWPFMYHLIKSEEGKDLEIDDEGQLIKEHSRALTSFMWLFLGFVVGFSFWYLVLPSHNSITYNAQIEVFCTINSPQNYNSCLQENGISITGKAAGTGYLLNIFTNNVSVLIFTLVFSLIFGAGAIFILAWNASVIGAAVGMFAKESLSNLHVGLLRYLIHGLPEIAAYFIGALAGGIISVAMIRRDLDGDRKWAIYQDAIILVIISLIVLFLSALVEVYFTPNFMNMLTPA
jgi:uncharacterized membrane protein SpoIIM required for sporulation